jgi:predicted enzyme related to lactoylglutathione lyase
MRFCRHRNEFFHFSKVHTGPGVGETVVYFMVEDWAVEEVRVSDPGGIVVRPKFSVGEFGWVTLCQDTEGNMFGLNSLK